MFAIHYTSIAPAVPGVYGAQVAVGDLVKAWCRYSTQEKLPFLIATKQEQEELTHLAQGASVDPARLVMMDRRYPRENFSTFRTLIRLDADSQNLFWQRSLVEKGFSFCGLTHATSGIEGGEVLQQYCLAPSAATDAIICPSRAVRSAIRAFWDHYGDYVRQRFGATFRCPVQLPVIPLGINVTKYERLTTPDKRATQRRALGLTDDDVVLLWVGRMSHAIKAHPLAMFQAAERAAEQTGKSVHLIMLGYFVPTKAEDQFRALARDFCQKVKVSFIANNDPRFPDGLWAAGDIFISLIENMQETFGLTPIEAMAAGLPRVITDWDGYRDGVRHGEDGFLVPTLQPPEGNGRDLANLLVTGREVYGGFLAKTALSVVIDVKAAAEALALLINDPQKRKAIADKARQRVRATYDWKHIIPTYETLWKELADKREAESAQGAPVFPLVPDPFTMYASYPTRKFDEKDRLRIAVPAEKIQQLWRHEINTFGHDMMVAPAETMQILKFLAAQDETAIGALFYQFPALDRPRLWRTLGWLLKLGILDVSGG